MTAEPRPLTETTIIDSDVHLTVLPEDVAEYVDPKYDHSVRSGNVFSNSIWDWSLGGNIGHDRFYAFTDINAVNEFKREFHIDYPIVNTFEPLDKFGSSEIRCALMRAYNDLLIAEILDNDTDVYGLAGIAITEPEAAVEEIERIADEKQIVGVYVGNNGVQPPPGDPRYDAVYRAAEDNDLPIAFHANADGFVRDFPIQNHGLETYLEVHSVNHLWYQTLAITSLITQGVPVKFPDLNFVILEAGISWIPYMMFRLNKEYGIRRAEAPLLEKQPESYLRESFYFATQPIGEPQNVRHMKSIIDIIGVDSLVFSSDYPHWDFDHPQAVNDHLSQYFTEEQRNNVFFETPKQAFRIP